jgi:hypothetical protein
LKRPFGEAEGEQAREQLWRFFSEEEIERACSAGLVRLTKAINLRHAAALALVGRYLMVPSIEGPIGLRAGVKAGQV